MHVRSGEADFRDVHDDVDGGLGIPGGCRERD
jgi:hypothetical protein